MALPISLCMIVKNEEDWIEKSLQSVKSIVSETIVVDTGSTDRTVEIAKGLGAKLYSFKWCDDFSKARNYSLQKATQDWILVLDADEVIAPSDAGTFNALIADRSICTEFLQRHYTNDHRLSDFKPCTGEFSELEKGQAGYFESNLVRLFPNREGLHYRGRVHELVEHSIYDAKRFKIVRTQVRIHHYGHSDQVKQKKKKGELYSPLGKTKIVEEANNWKAFYELGVEHNVNNRKEESVEAFKKSLSLNPQYVQTWVNCGYALMELGRLDEAFSYYQEALALDPKCADAYCNMGVVGIRKRDWALAERASKQAIALQPHYVNAWCNLGRAYVLSGRLAEGALAFKRAIEFVPQSIPARADLAAVYLQAGLAAECENVLVTLREQPEHLLDTEQIRAIEKGLSEIRSSRSNPV